MIIDEQSKSMHELKKILNLRIEELNGQLFEQRKIMDDNVSNEQWI